MNAMLPAHLSETLNNLGDAARALTEEVRADSERRVAEMRATALKQRRQNRIVVMLLVVVAVLVLSLLTIVVQNRHRSNQNAEILRQTANTSAQIADCTNAGGKCYEQGAKRTADILRLIIRAQVYLPSCERVSATDTETEQCVLRKLTAQAGATPEPTGQSPVPAPAESGD